MLDKVIHHKSIDSTNLEAYRRRAEYAGLNVLFSADEQTAGKGQQGRSWESRANKGLWMSLFLSSPDILQRDLQLLSLFTGLILQRSISKVTGVYSQLKWPNDIMIGSRKCAGILTEVQWKGSEAGSAIIGMGINLNHSASDFSPEIRNASTSLALSGAEKFDKEALKDRIVQEFFSRITLLDDSGKLVDLWNRDAWKLNELVEWQQGEKHLSGRFRGVDPTGCAQLQIEGELRSFSSGEIRWSF